MPQGAPRPRGPSCALRPGPGGRRHSPRACPRPRPPCPQAPSWAWSCCSCFPAAAGAELPPVPPGKQVWDVAPGASTPPEGWHCWGASHPEVGHLAPLRPGQLLCLWTGEEAEARSPRAAPALCARALPASGHAPSSGQTPGGLLNSDVRDETGSKPKGPRQRRSGRWTEPRGAGGHGELHSHPEHTLRGPPRGRVTLCHPECSPGTRQPRRAGVFPLRRLPASPETGV